MGSNDWKVCFTIVFLILVMNLLIGRNQPPWDDTWQLDSKFFTQMEEWDTAHPESTLTKVLEKVNGAVTSCQPFIGYIPDSPFPARSLVQGLAYLLQLGSVRQVLISFHRPHHNLFADDRQCKKRRIRFHDTGLNLVLYCGDNFSQRNKEEI